MIYGFENYALDADRRELRNGGVLVAVEPLVFDLLQYLIGNRDRVASKDDLIATVWRGRIVSDSTLTSRMNAARHAIGDSGEQHDGLTPAWHDRPTVECASEQPVNDQRNLGALKGGCGLALCCVLGGRSQIRALARSLYD